ncbi:hypothetical protein ACN6LA_000006 [Streptomyces sp. SAS_269]|uniref:hypothetical protein n=1 Tax=Streptomyces sp. SAS_269 TaxID=3412749 RepID=UPI00403CECC1
MFVPPVIEDEQWLGAVCGCFGERDGFCESCERERPALRNAQHPIDDETEYKEAIQAMCEHGRPFLESIP